MEIDLTEVTSRDRDATESLLRALPCSIAAVPAADPGAPVLSLGAQRLASRLVGGDSVLASLAVEAASHPGEPLAPRRLESWDGGPMTIRAETASAAHQAIVTFVDETELHRELEVERHAREVMEQAFDHLPVAAYSESPIPAGGVALRVNRRFAERFGEREIPEHVRGVTPDGELRVTDGADARVRAAATSLEDGTRIGVVLEHDEHFERLERAEEAQRSKSRFVAKMSHELRTPLYGVLGMLDLALEDGEGEHRTRAIRSAQDCADRLLRLVNDILELSKAEAHELKLQVASNDLDGLLRQTVDDLSEYARRDGVTVELVREKRAEDDRVLSSNLRVDGMRLQQVVSNLLSNAIKFSPDDSTVDVRFRRVEDPSDDARELVTISVVDRGIGIAPDQIDAIFTEFGQVESAGAGSSYVGTGLGLPITKEIVELMGGSIEVDSIPGQGTTFRVTLSLERCRDLPVDAEGRRIDELKMRASRVLVAEDNPINQKVIERFLIREGHQVTVVGTGIEAIAKLEEHEHAYDFVLMDMEMPVMDGLAATRRIRELEKECSFGSFGRRLPIVFLSAHCSDDVESSCRDAGGDGYLAKPLQRTPLVRELMRVTPERVA